MTYYVNTHDSQYDPGASAITRQEGCTWTSGANGVNATSGGRYAPTPDDIHDRLKRWEEVNPDTPGWHLLDLEKALGRYGAQFEVHTGEGYRSVIRALANGRYVVLQGDSDQFRDATCSGQFNGDHAVGVHPRTRVAAGVLQRWINDPICPHGRWENDATLRRYAEKLWPSVRFGHFTAKVPQAESWRWKVAVREGERYRDITRFVLNKERQIIDVEEYRTKGMNVACTAPKRYIPAPGKPDVWGRELVQLVIPGKKRNGWLMDARFAEEE